MVGERVIDIVRGGFSGWRFRDVGILYRFYYGGSVALGYS